MIEVTSAARELVRLDAKLSKQRHIQIRERCSVVAVFWERVMTAVLQSATGDQHRDVTAAVLASVAHATAKQHDGAVE